MVRAVRNRMGAGLAGRFGPVVPRNWRVAAALVIGAGVVALLWPVLSAPVNGDDRYWYMAVPGYAEGSFGPLLDRTLDRIPAELDRGRFTPLSSLTRKVVTAVGAQWAVATTTPIQTFHGLLKVGLLLVVFAAAAGFLGALRIRSSDGTLRTMAPADRVAVLLTTAALLAVVAQSHAQFRNGWTTYPVLTYGVAAVALGVAAGLVHLTRQMVERPSPHRTWVAVSVAVMAGLVLNMIYEIYYVTVPFALAMVWLVPLAATGAAVAERRVRLTVTAAFAGSFGIAFVVIRAITARCAANGTCYEGSALSLGLRTVRTFALNTVSFLPGVSQPAVSADLERLGATAGWPGPAVLLPLLALLLAAAVIVTWLGRSEGTEPAQDRFASGADLTRLARFAAISVAGLGLGAALIMSVSDRAPEIVAALGAPYRHTVATAFSFAFAGALLVAALLAGTTLRRTAVLATLAAVIVGSMLITHPQNLAATRGYRVDPSHQAIERLHWEVVLGDRTPDGDGRRCRVFAEVARTHGQPWVQQILRPGVRNAYRHFHGADYCSRWG